MKKITLLTILMLSVAGFSQTNRQLIQTYLESNKAKFDLTSQDLTDWSILSEVPGSGTQPGRDRLLRFCRRFAEIDEFMLRKRRFAFVFD